MHQDVSFSQSVALHRISKIHPFYFCNWNVFYDSILFFLAKANGLRGQGEGQICFTFKLQAK